MGDSSVPEVFGHENQGGERLSKRFEVWSCGGGTQSGAIAALIGMGKLPRPDICFMTDTGREKSGTWPFVEGFIRPQLAKAGVNLQVGVGGVELQIIKAIDFGGGSLFGGEDGKTALMPGFTNITGSVGKLSPFCSGSWKTDIGERFLRSLGIESARNWIGISIDEMRRVRRQHRPWLELWYPLIFAVPMRRYQCVELIRSVGWLGPIPHSACYMCPNMGDAEWIDLKLNWPLDFAAACAVEAEVRAVDQHFYCHPSCVPLAEVDFFAQTTMFADHGCTAGCFT